MLRGRPPALASAARPTELRCESSASHFAGAALQYRLQSTYRFRFLTADRVQSAQCFSTLLPQRTCPPGSAHKIAREGMPCEFRGSAEANYRARRLKVRWLLCGSKTSCALTPRACCTIQSRERGEKEKAGRSRRRPAEAARRRRAKHRPAHPRPGARARTHARALTGSSSAACRAPSRRTSSPRVGAGRRRAASGRRPEGCPSPPSCSPRPRLRDGRGGMGRAGRVEGQVGGGAVATR